MFSQRNKCKVFTLHGGHFCPSCWVITTENVLGRASTQLIYLVFHIGRTILSLKLRGRTLVDGANMSVVDVRPEPLSGKDEG